MLTEEIKVLDHGYVRYIDGWGSDQAIVEAARMSTDKGFLGWGPIHADTCPSTVPEKWVKQAQQPGQKPEWIDHGPCNCTPKTGDERLLKYLWMQKHSTPFEMGGLVIEVQAPILCFREWHRHRTQSYSELSARYTQMPNIHWQPTLGRIRDGIAAAGANKQAQGTTTLADDAQIKQWLYDGAQLQSRIYEHYELGLALGIPKEVARYNTPVSRYSRMRACANLLNWLRFLGLRMAPDAQREIRECANAVGELIAQRFPRTWALFEEQKI